MSYYGKIPVSTYFIRTATDLDNLASGGIITISSNTQLIFENISAITTSNRFAVTVGTLSLNTNGGVRELIYNGGGTFFTISGTGALDQNEVNINGSGTGTLFNISSINAQIEVDNTNYTSWSALGSIECNIGAIRNTNFIIWGSGLNVDASNFVLSTGSSVLTSSASTSFLTYTSKASSPTIDMYTLGMIGYPHDFIFIDPCVSKTGSIGISEISSSGNLFSTSGSTGTFTAVSDASISTTTITSVTDNSGIAHFNFTGPTVYVDQEVIISNFVTNITYNTTGIITATDGTSYFEIREIYTPVAYTGSEASVGSFISNSVTLTDTATSLSNGDCINIQTNNAIDYDDGAIVYNKQTNSVQVNKTWTQTKSGTWSTKSLDHTSPIVSVSRTASFTNSAYIAFAHIEGNTTYTSISTANTYQNLNLTGSSKEITAFATNGAGGTTVTSATHGLLEYQNIGISGTTNYNGRFTIFNVTTNTFDISVAFVANDATGTWSLNLYLDDITQRFKLTNIVTGELTYTGKEPFEGRLNYVYGAMKTGNAESYLFSANKNNTLQDGWPYARRTITTEASITVYSIPISLVKGDTIAPQVSAVGVTDSILFQNVQISVN